MKKPIIGMLHMGGDCAISQSLQDLEAYQEAGVDAVIVENYCATLTVVTNAMGNIMRNCKNMIVGVNILPNQFTEAFQLIDEFKAKFIQLDYISGTYAYSELGLSLDLDKFNRDKKRYDKDNKVAILGGVHPKYYLPIEGSDLIQDLQDGMNRADAIVVTGEGTGMETPIKKIEEFRKIVKNFPLIVGAGMDVTNVKTHLALADGAIVGSTFKPNGDVDKKVELKRVKEFMNVVNELRATV